MAKKDSKRNSQAARHPLKAEKRKQTKLKPRPRPYQNEPNLLKQQQSNPSKNKPGNGPKHQQMTLSNSQGTAFLSTSHGESHHLRAEARTTAANFHLQAMALAPHLASFSMILLKVYRILQWFSTFRWRLWWSYNILGFA